MNYTDDDLYKMDANEFRKFADSKEFSSVPEYVRFNLVWLRLNRNDRQSLIQLYANNKGKIIGSTVLESQILYYFKEAKLVSLNMEKILEVIEGFYDPGIPIHYY